MAEMADVVSVNVAQRLALMDDGAIVPLTNLIDADGDETDDPAAAVTAVAPYAGKWFAIVLTDFRDAEVH